MHIAIWSELHTELFSMILINEFTRILIMYLKNVTQTQLSSGMQVWRGMLQVEI